MNTSQPEMVVAILRELDRQTPGCPCSIDLFAMICQSAEQITRQARKTAPTPTDEAA